LINKELLLKTNKNNRKAFIEWSSNQKYYPEKEDQIFLEKFNYPPSYVYYQY
jgi:hypothetical protein